MKFKFNKFGPIDSGEVELGDLTIICGPNNAGKTYASYAIYGFLRLFKQFIQFPLEQAEVDSLNNDGSIQIELKRYFADMPKIINNAIDKFSNTLDEFFSAPDDFFKGAELSFLKEISEIDFSIPFNLEARFGKGITLIFDKEECSSLLSIALKVEGKSTLPHRIIQDVVSDAIADCIFHNQLPKPFVVTSERTGVALFYKELDLNKNAIFEHLTENEKINPIKLLNSMSSRYAKPIQDNINIVRDYENINKKKSYICENKEVCQPVISALRDILGGSFKATEKQVFFHPQKEKNREKIVIPVYICSSSVKSLFLIDLYINSLAEKNGLLIIDEPELNLHPDNQRKMASLLARLVNAGIKVMITTHSDYLIKDLNNRIMLSNDFEDKPSLLKKLKMIEEDILKPEQVRAYVMENHSIESIEIDKNGIRADIFDSIISEANSQADDIYYNIQE